jgi:hypothetical protein
MSDAHPYFDGLSGARQVVWWSVATRLPLEELEASVAADVARSFAPGAPEADGHAIWHEQRCHCAALFGARNILRAVALLDPPLRVEEALASEIKSGRDLWEHWDQNMPIFNTRGSQEVPPRTSGKRFKKRHPGHSPYGSAWTSREGVLLTPALSAHDIHALLDQAETCAVTVHPPLVDYIPARAPSPWIDNPDVEGYWPRRD